MFVCVCVEREEVGIEALSERCDRRGGQEHSWLRQTTEEEMTEKQEQQVGHCLPY